MRIYKIKDICRLEKGKQIDTTLLDDANPYKYINGGIKESGYYTSYNTEGEAVLVSEGGASCGYVNYINEKFWCGCHCYKLTECKFLPKYIYYALKGNQDKLMALRTGAAMPNIKKSTFQDMKLKLNDDFAEQEKVINELDKIQIAIDTKQTELIALDDLVKSRFIEMFGTLDLSIQGESWLDLSDVSTIFTGTTPSTKDGENWNGDIPWVTPAELSDDSFVVCDTERKITQKGMKSKSLSLLPKNTVLLSTRAPIGKVAITGIEMCCNQGFKNFYCNNTVLNPIYLYTLLKNNNEYLNSLGTGTTFKEISKKNASKIKVPVADISLQNEFADFVKLIDKSKFVG